MSDLSDLGRATASLELSGEDEMCPWYRRPVISGPAYPRLLGRGVLESRLCAECMSLGQAILGARPDTSSSRDGQGDIAGVCLTPAPPHQGYTFRKPYSQTRDDAKLCALCQTVEDSVVLTQKYAAGHNPSQIPPDSHIHLEPVTSSDEDLIGFDVMVSRENTNESDSESSSSDSDTTSSASSEWKFKSKPTRKGFLEVAVQETESAQVVENLSSSDVIKERGAVNILGSNFRTAAPWRDMTQMLRSWLQECDSVHDVCQHARRSSKDVDTSAPPKRLLEIHRFSGHFRIRLVADTGAVTRYTALSHRWGDYRSTRTTTTNIDEYRNEIDFDSLSLTLRQAIQITHAAGICHLWVDCLCIIQDDVHDWAQEAPRMGSIYASAYFTIAASAFEDEGCFPLKFPKIHHATIDLHPGFELKISPRSSDFNDWAIEYEPLQKRGWTLQERLLSQRILYCSRYEYYWLCRDQRLRAWGDPGRFFQNESLWPVNDKYQSPPDLLLSRSAQSREAALSKWYLLLFDYSDRQLTLEKDKLIAINGLTDIFQRWIGSRYLHGLWECDLVCGLAWYPGRHWSNDFSDSDSEKAFKAFGAEESRFWRIFPNRAPSWSWASADGFQEHLGAEFMLLAGALGKPLSELTYLEATVASEDEYRPFLAGEMPAESQLLKISGRLFKVFHGWKDTEAQDEHVWQLDREGDPVVFKFIPDDPNFDPDEHAADEEGSRLYVLPIVAYIGLVITPASDDGVPLYRRVGTSNFIIPLLVKRLNQDSSDGSTAGNVDDGPEYSTVQTNDSIIEAVGTENKAASEGLDKDADAKLDTGSISSSDRGSAESESTSGYLPGLSYFWTDFAKELQWLGKTGVYKTVFLC